MRRERSWREGFARVELGLPHEAAVAYDRASLDDPGSAAAIVAATIATVPQFVAAVPGTRAGFLNDRWKPSDDPAELIWFESVHVWLCSPAGANGYAYPLTAGPGDGYAEGGESVSDMCWILGPGEDEAAARAWAAAELARRAAAADGVPSDE